MNGSRRIKDLKKIKDPEGEGIMDLEQDRKDQKPTARRVAKKESNSRDDTTQTTPLAPTTTSAP